MGKIVIASQGRSNIGIDELANHQKMEEKMMAFKI